MGRLFRDVFVLVLMLVVPSLSIAQAQDAKTALKEDRVIAGGPKDFLEARHLVLRGNNEEIGRALSTLAKERYALKPEASTDRLRTRAQRRYFEKNYPILHDRMKGVAAAFGRPLDDDAFNFSGLPYLLGPPPGCSVVYCPPSVTADGKGVLSRDYDFGTGTLLDAKPKSGELPVNARPYLVEMHPDKGYPSLAMCAFDLLSGALDGVNSEGLAVAMLADDAFAPKVPIEPAIDGAAGLDEIQVVRFLLDTCATVDDAKVALLSAKQYYSFLPNHYLIADRFGNAFVWEHSQAHNREYLVENPGKPLISTNFRLHQYMKGTALPSADDAKGVCDRYCLIAKRLAAAPGKLSIDFIKKTHREVDATAPAIPLIGGPPIRTLWHALYYPEQRKVQLSFYLGEESDPQQKGKVRIRRSNYLEFTLK